MTGGQLAVPLVVVGSAGAAGSNAAQHSEVPSALFLQAGGLRVVFPSTPHQAFWLMRAAIESDDPVVVLHHPALGGDAGQVAPEPLGLGEAQVDPVGTDVSVFATGMMAHRARAAARSSRSGRHLGRGRRRLQPEPDALGRHARLGREDRPRRRRRRGPADLLGRLRDRGRARPSGLSGRCGPAIRRLAVPDVPIPFAPNLEQAVIPGEDDIAAAVREIARG